VENDTPDNNENDVKPEQVSNGAKKKEISRHDLHYVKDSKAAVLTDTPRYAWLALYLMIAVLFFAIVWAYFAKIDLVTSGEGRIIPSAQLQVVQNLEGGIVAKIYVKEGQLVEKGQLVVKLDDTRFASTYKENLAKMAVLKAEIIRLTAESHGKEAVIFPAELKKKRPDIVASETKLFNARKQILQEELALLRDSMALTHKKLKIVTPLVKQGVMSQIDGIQLERELNAIQNQILEKKNKARKEAEQQLNRIKSEKAVLVETLKGSYDRLFRTSILSPVKGVVNNIYVSTIGEVVSPGGKMMDIVPFDKSLTVEANIKPADIGFIVPGQKAIIKVSAYNFTTYGGIDAKVKNISADTVVNEKGDRFYEVKLQTDVNYLAARDKKLEIIPGMTVTVDVMTGKRSILNFLLKPFLRGKEKALRER